MSRNSLPDNYVRIAKCRFCGGSTNSILLHKFLRSIPENQSYDSDPCDNCKVRFETMSYFMGNCDHSGFVKNTIIKEHVDPSMADSIIERKIFRMEKCFPCISGQNIKDFEHI